MAIESVPAQAIIEHGFDGEASDDNGTVKVTFVYDDATQELLDLPVDHPEGGQGRQYTSRAIMSEAVRLLFDLDRSARPQLVCARPPIPPQDQLRLASMLGEPLTEELGNISPERAHSRVGLYVLHVCFEPSNIVELMRFQVSQPNTPPNIRARCEYLLSQLDKDTPDTQSA